MKELFIYLTELNISIVILYVAYKLFFEKDKNFVVRRIYLLGVILFPLIILLLPEKTVASVSSITPTFRLEGVSISGIASAKETASSFSISSILMTIYLTILSLGLLKLCIQLTIITFAIIRSERINKEGITILLNRSLHASSFFGFIFIDSDSLQEESFHHILEHENTHKREWHSVDRILTELFVVVNWFNPMVWLFRKSMIQNLEYLADAAVLKGGTDPMKYQLSILNQYMGIASLSNQFSSQIKNRITMLNKDYKLGSSWKLILLLPFVMIALYAISCSENETSELPELNGIGIEVDEDGNEYYKIEEMPKWGGQKIQPEEEVFYVVEEMPTFNEGEPATEFRKYIAKNLNYPEIAIQNRISGRVIVQFAVNPEGEVVDARVVRSVSPALDKEAIRVVMSSPEWIPGKQRGKSVKVLFTFPINFVLQ